jgi:neopullulanase
LALFVSAAFAGAAPVVTKVDPPNWWVPHTLNPIQVLLTGKELNGATVTTAAKGFQIETRYISTNGHYLFVYLDIGKQVKPGEYHFQVRSASGTGEFVWRLDHPLGAQGRFQGFGPDDVIYLLMPDRFAMEGPATNRPPPANPPPFIPPAAQVANTNGTGGTNALAGGGRGGRGGRGGGQGYHGGNIQGIIEHLDYLKDLGVTGVWMTPVYQNSSASNRGAYHGYSTVDLLNRAGTNSVSLAVDDIAVPEGLHFKSFPEGLPDLAVTAHKLEIKEPRQIEIYWADRRQERTASPKR